MVNDIRIESTFKFFYHTNCHTRHFSIFGHMIIIKEVVTTPNPTLHFVFIKLKEIQLCFKESRIEGNNILLGK